MELRSSEDVHWDNTSCGRAICGTHTSVGGTCTMCARRCSTHRCPPHPATRLTDEARIDSREMYNLTKGCSSGARASMARTRAGSLTATSSSRWGKGRGEDKGRQRDKGRNEVNGVQNDCQRHVSNQFDVSAGYIRSFEALPLFTSPPTPLHTPPRITQHNCMK